MANKLYIIWQVGNDSSKSNSFPEYVT